ncbi:MAG: plastocyanin/azurin family copper-binding protein [Halobacteriaceae archaeon]
MYWTRGRAVVQETSEVTMGANQFHPRNIHVPTGTEVTWTNPQNYQHTVIPTTVNGQFEQWTIGPEANDGVTVGSGNSVNKTFEESGVYAVYCKIHGSPNLNGMSMKIAVGDAEIQQPLGGWF